MPKGRETKGRGDPGVASRRAADRLAVDLRQPLTAASNYIGAARLSLSSGDTSKLGAAARNLETAEDQILRAAKIIGQLRRKMAEDAAEFQEKMS